MAISRGRELLSQLNPNPDEIKKSIAALNVDANHVRKCINAGLRDYSSGQAVIINEICDFIQQ